MNEKTKVIFRLFYGSVIALFPEVPGADPFNCVSYGEDGEKKDVNPYYIISRSIPAEFSEYKNLFAKLTQMGYALTLRERHKDKYLQTRKEETNL